MYSLSPGPKMVRAFSCADVTGGMDGFSRLPGPSKGFITFLVILSINACNVRPAAISAAGKRAWWKPPARHDGERA